MSIKIYKESQKAAKDGKMVNYPAASLTIDIEKKSILFTYNSGLPSQERKALFNKISFSYSCAAGENNVITPPAKFTFTEDENFEIEGATEQPLKKLRDMNYISNVTYSQILEDIKPKPDLFWNSCSIS